jgi:Fic family protein
VGRAKPLIAFCKEGISMGHFDDIPPHAARVSTDRRNHIGRKALLRRVQGEFEEMPGIPLTVNQASRLLSISPDIVSRIFNQLVEDGILRLTPDGRYRRPESAP